MRPEYWIGILAVVGSLAGTLLGIILPNINGTTAAVSGTIIGIVTGTIVYAYQKNQKKSDE